MGRRAKKAPVQTKKRPTLAKRFKCPFCANEEAVECKMDHRNGLGSLACRLCGASYQMPIHHLHEPIDVFSEWLDDCDAAQRGGGGRDDAPAGAGGSSVPLYESSDDEDDDIPESSGIRAKAPGAPAPAASGGAAAAATGGALSYSALGLDDSDDDDDDSD